MNSVAFALLAYFGWGLGDTLSAWLSRKMKVGTIAFWGYVFRFGIYLVLIPILGSSLSSQNIPYIGLQLLIGLVTAMGYVAYYKGCQMINPTVVSAIAGSWGGVAMIVSLVFLGERPTVFQGFAIALLILGLLMTLFGQKGLKLDYRKKQTMGMMLAVVAMMGWVVCGSITKITIANLGWFWSTFFLILPYMLVIISTKRLRMTIERKLNKNQLLSLMAYAGLMALAELSFFIALERGMASIVSPVAGSYVTLVVLLSFFLFNDPITKWQKWGVGITCLGVVGLAVLVW